MNKKFIFYGAGRNAAALFDYAKVHPETTAIPTLEEGFCFVDSDLGKQGTHHLGLPVYSMSEARRLYPAARYFITLGDKVACRKVIANLLEQGVPFEFIGGLRESCHYLENFVVCGYHEGAFGGRAGVDCGGHSLKSCCSDYGKNSVDYVPIGDDFSRSFAQFLALRTRLLQALALGEPCCCSHCQQLIESFAAVPHQFEYVIYNELGRCNFKCCYCNHDERLGRDTKDDVSVNILMDTIKTYGFSQNGIVELCAGEITVLKNKHDIYNYVKNYRVMFISNGFIFDNEISERLKSRNDVLNISVDAGTEETFFAVKGVRGFEKVRCNIVRYGTGRKGIINLKYILLPGVNDNVRDIDGFLHICQEAAVDCIHVSCDLSLDKQDYDNPQTAACLAYFVDRLKSLGISFEIYSKDILENLLQK